jgi:hypothetical protein
MHLAYMLLDGIVVFSKCSILSSNNLCQRRLTHRKM